MPEMVQREALISSTQAAETNPDPHQAAALPPWIHANEDGDEEDNLLAAPSHARPSTRHYKPPTHYKPGRKWDHFRSDEPALLSAPIADHHERWRGFMASGPHPHAAEGRVVDAAWMEENMPALCGDWGNEDEKAVGHGITASGMMYKGMWLISPERQEKTMKLFWVSHVSFYLGRLELTESSQRLLLKNAYIPLFLRLVVLAFTIAALAMAASIYRNVHRVNMDADPNNQCSSRASSYMAIVVSSVAIPYIGYVTWDEYMSKPYVLSLPRGITLDANRQQTRPAFRCRQDLAPPLRSLLRRLRLLERHTSA